MKTFTDAANRTWTIRLTLGTAKAVRDTLGIDLLQPEAGEPPNLVRLGTDEILLGEVICALLIDQFEAHKLSAEQVRESFDGQTLQAAATAFWGELESFFLSRGRSDRAMAVRKQGEMLVSAIAQVTDKLGKLSISGEMFTDSPEPSGSIPVV